MADKVEQPKEVDTVEVTDKAKAEEKPVEVVQNGDKAPENGEAKEEPKKAESEKVEEKTKDTEPEEKPSAKRKSTGGGDATDSVTKNTPDKKAKLEEKVEAESKAEAEVTA